MVAGPVDGGADALAWRLDAFNKLLLSASPVTSITSGLLREACRALGAHGGAFLVADAADGRMRAVSLSGMDELEGAALCAAEQTRSLVRRCVASGQPHFLRLPCIDPAIGCSRHATSECEALLCVPIRGIEDRRAAVLFGRFSSRCPRDEEFLRIALLLGSSLDIALRSAARLSGNGHAAKRAGLQRRAARPPSAIGAATATATATAPRAGGSPNGAAAGAPVAPEEGDEAVSLTVRRRQILKLLARGLSNKEIAAITGLSVFTVRDHVSALLRILGVPSRAAAIAKAVELGLVAEQDSPLPGARPDTDAAAALRQPL